MCNGDSCTYVIALCFVAEDSSHEQGYLEHGDIHANFRDDANHGNRMVKTRNIIRRFYTTKIAYTAIFTIMEFICVPIEKGRLNK